MSEQTYPVEWKGQTLYLRDVSIGIKNGFVAYTKLELTADAIATVGKLAPEQLPGILAGMLPKCWWGDGGMSGPVYETLHSPKGARHLNRLLFGDSVKRMSDADIEEMMIEKEREPTSDYMVAMQFIREDADPKKAGPATGADQKAGTSSTATT